MFFKSAKVPKSPKIKPKTTFWVKVSKFLSTIFLIVSIIFVSGVGMVAWEVNAQSQKLKGGIDLNPLAFISAGLANAVTGSRAPIKGESEGRTNFLVVGLDPENGNSDTMIIISYFHKEKKVAAVNIPRDLYITESATGINKLNSIYPIYRNSKQLDPKSSAEKLVKFIEDEFKVPLHYWATININGLSQMIDQLGGVDVKIDNDFTDYTFPTDGYTGFIKPAPSFKTGVEKMNGTRASIYARSRHADGVEGGDFARSRRSNIVIAAILTKIKTNDIWSNISNISGYLKVLGDNIQTNMTPEEMISSGQLLKDINPQNDYYKGIWQNGNGFLCDFNNGTSYVAYGAEGNCGRFLAGSKTPNKYRTMAQEYVLNMLAEAKFDEIQYQTINLIGNNSPTIVALSKELTNNRMTFNVNNNFRFAGTTNTKSSTPDNQSKSSTAPIQSKVSVYIPDKKIKQIFSELNPKPFQTEYEFVESLPQEITNNKTINSAKDIIIYDAR